MISIRIIITAILSLVIVWEIREVDAFTTATTTTFARLPTTTRRWSTTEETATSSTATESTTAIQNAKSTLQQLGIEEGKLALGVKPDEVLKYIGTREDLIVKTLEDIPKFDRQIAEKEVDKFLMDAEMVNMYIQFGKEVERDPDFKVPELQDEDEGTTIPSVFRTYVATQELAGTWKPTGIAFIDEWITNTSEEATAKVLEQAAKKAAEEATAITQSVDIVSTTADNIISTASSSDTAVQTATDVIVQSANIIDAAVQTLSQ